MSGHVLGPSIKGKAHKILPVAKSRLSKKFSGSRLRIGYLVVDATAFEGKKREKKRKVQIHSHTIC